MIFSLFNDFVNDSISLLLYSIIIMIIKPVDLLISLSIDRFCVPHYFTRYTYSKTVIETRNSYILIEVLIQFMLFTIINLFN